MKTKHSTEPDSCQFPFADGRRCRMLRQRNHPYLCPFHARAEQQLQESHHLGSEIAASLTGNYLTAADVTHVLGKVFTALAQNRIPQPNAQTLAYLGQVMLGGMPQVRAETDFVYSYEAWQHRIKNAIHVSAPCPQPPPLALESQIAPPAPLPVPVTPGPAGSDGNGSEPPASGDPKKPSIR